ncbi:alanine--tRNA ligase, cytoplasmic-like [Saccostrea echinata]|uniref:alanine--tRNA ligase, cytoplasmic-like n=1 Tax=Saccostrea echinata TaxID=191078 RepID=UPI002A7EC134|nr:alanine--tRNA ligase, cytoplasmic-like [Saccostrea echinata]
MTLNMFRVSGHRELCKNCRRLLYKSFNRRRSSVSWTSSSVRAAFLDFFCGRHGHQFVPSSSIIAKKGEGSYFINAGMNQFKPIFLNDVEEGSPMASYRRVANSQKCVRVGGKHNDLEDVGLDLTHHTFFEMLGSWSFGDYFKRDACALALELLRDVYKIPLSSLYFTYFKGDDSMQLPKDLETRDIWLSLGVDRSHVLPFGMKDNFWDMGQTGPCGPCTEIHYDHHPGYREVPHLVNADSPEVVEIWNLVFMQFNRQGDKALIPLLKNHVDTGMGLERITAVLQGSTSNYDTDLFRPIFDAIHKDCGIPSYKGKIGSQDLLGKDTAYRIVADHMRMLTVCLSEGVLPDKADPHGHKVRSVLYRCLQSSKVLDIRPGYISSLVDFIVDSLGAAHPELNASCKRVKDVINESEEHYHKTQEQGTRAFNKFLRKRKQSGHINDSEYHDLLSGHYGAPVPMEILEDLAQKHHLSIPISKRGSEEQTDKQTIQEEQIYNVCNLKEKNIPRTDDHYKYMYKGTISPYDFPDLSDTKVVGILSGKSIEILKSGDKGIVILDKTCFYAESGGQVGDTGVLKNETGVFIVTDTQTQGDYVQHIGHVEEGEIRIGDKLTASINQERRLGNMRAHTATHLLNHSLRHLASDARQNGSHVEEDRLYFEVFTAKKLDTVVDVTELQREVREVIERRLQVTCQNLPLSQAQSLDGVVYMQNEIYPHMVNVITIGAGKPVSVELCGGTHVHNTGEIGDFCIEKLKGVGQGRKSVYCFTGKLATIALENGATLRNIMNELERAVKQNQGTEDWESKVKTINKMMWGDLLPKLEREDVENRLNQIGHVITTKLNQIHEQKLRKEIINSHQGSCDWVLLTTDYGNLNVIKKAMNKLKVDKAVVIVNTDGKTTHIVMYLSESCDPRLKQQLMTVISNQDIQLKSSKTKDGKQLYITSIRDADRSKDLQQSLSDIYHKELTYNNKV